MASFDFYCDFNLNIQNLGGSGIGFYGPGGFGSSIKVGDYQDNTYITDASGAVQGPQGNNVKYVHPNSGMIPTNNTLLLRNIPNYQGSVNVRFSRDGDVLRPGQHQQPAVRTHLQDGTAHPPLDHADARRLRRHDMVDAGRLRRHRQRDHLRPAHRPREQPGDERVVPQRGGNDRHPTRLVSRVFGSSILDRLEAFRTFSAARILVIMLTYL
jgi:hypothetical protein